MKKCVPRHEPEVILAAANRYWRGDAEKVADTSIKVAVEKGVEITSRYQKANEVFVMTAMVDALSESLSTYVLTLFCDSKASHTYSVTIKSWNKDIALEIARRFESVAVAMRGGHNGICVAVHSDKSMFGDHDRRVDLDPEWGD